MTATDASTDIFSRFGGYAKRASSWLARAGFGVFVVAAAGVALLATTILGLFLTVAALCLKAAHSFGRGSRSSASPKPRREMHGDTLDATQTPDGWVIDPKAPKPS